MYACTRVLFITTLLLSLIACQSDPVNPPRSAASLSPSGVGNDSAQNLSIRIDWVEIGDDLGELFGDSEVYFELFVIREDGDSRLLRAPAQGAYRLVPDEALSLDQFSLSVNNLQADEQIFVYLLALESDELSSQEGAAIDFALNAGSIALEEALTSGQLATMASGKASVVTFIVASVAGAALDWWQEADIVGEYAVLLDQNNGFLIKESSTEDIGQNGNMRLSYAIFTEKRPFAAPPSSSSIGDNSTTNFRNGSGQFVYSAKIGQTRELFTYDTASGNTQQLTHDAYNDEVPVWSPDGRYIAYTSERNSRFDIFILDTQTGSIQNLTNHPEDDAYPSWSPDGRKLLFHSNRNGDFDIFMINADGSNLKQITNNDVPDLAPEWSPDGSRISFTQAYNNRRQIAMMNTDGSNIYQITSGENHSRAHPSWSPNGRQLAFHMVPSLSIQSGIFVIDADGNNLQQLTNGEDFEARWTPDGEWISFHRRTGDIRKIYKIRPDGTELTVVLDTPSDVRQADWQP